MKKANKTFQANPNGARYSLYNEK